MKATMTMDIKGVKCQFFLFRGQDGKASYYVVRPIDQGYRSLTSQGTTTREARDGMANAIKSHREKNPGLAGR